ncbi:MAG: hypothetical protein COT15_00755 [Candidatus Diapherotrites archaeon CG08_land_8_20_14_0_20_34_12]|nr:MAG: hypothetical protein COT15_00755 [Candidatus Diapherotrites archaeon CG08_land_8_20_14_0_20_34_12]
MKIAMDEIFYINEFDKFSGVYPRDCIIQKSNIVYIIESADIGKAIGKNGSTVKGFSTKINKRVLLLAYYESIKKFIEEGLDIKINEIAINDEIAFLKLDSMTKRKLVNDIAKFKLIKQVVERNYNIKDIRVK